MYYFISYTLIWFIEHTIPLQKASIAHFANDGVFWLNIVTSSQLTCDVTRMRGTDIMMLYSSIVLTRANWCKGDLH